MRVKTFEQINQFHYFFIKFDKLINEVIEEKKINISREQLGVFKLLLKYRKLTLKQIAIKQGVFKTAISKRIKKLEERGFVKQTKSSDKREKLIELTDCGKQFYNERQILLYEGLMEKIGVNEMEVDEIYMYIEKINGIIKKEN